MATYSAAVDAANLEPTVAYNMVGKVAKQIVKGVQGDNRLAELHRGTIENGETVEDVVFGLVEGSALVDTVPGTPFSAPEATPVVNYFKTWNQTQYSTGLTQRKLRKYLTTGASVEDIAGIVAGQLAQSAEAEDYENIKGMLINLRAEMPIAPSANTTSGKIYAPDTNNNDLLLSNPNKILLALKNAVADLKFTNDKCNKAGVKRRTLSDDIVILMPYDIFNLIEVDVLAGVFNLSKAEVMEHIIIYDPAIYEHDTFLYKDIVVADRNAFQIWTREYDMTEAFDAQQVRMNYFLTVDRLYGISTLYDAIRVPVRFGLA